ncbi:integral membrane sensor signal transduction histidine kinase [Ruminiclostridium papyrosolvens DSM 2782]|uniref:histidine kinase n=1 Tax=Ruminiclostridium papyrosolvens DSM 2782 TaxID=588581 RepID=F1TA21_9FIRM|nr:ATP-binding protein [Ruminiclostridium papyrosolvens]EGD48763.1 integral membrane sensor signal transduction histidine kinase [Ruminiclostridium papyrosolvens DSM 2782]WES32482.1 ATP-binding protein [Ruminiclostridium papyrosolvens DSM 2782]
MNSSLRTKLSISYVAVALICIILISIFTTLFVYKHFEEYVKQNTEQKNREIVTTLSGQYMGNGKWNTKVIETIGVSSMENGIILKVKDINGNIIWDAKTHNNGMCQRIIEHMSNNASRIPGRGKSGYTEVPYTINYNLNKVGTVEIGTYGDNYLNEHDIAFINDLYNLLWAVGIFSLILSLLFGTVMSKRLVSPIARVINTAKAISKGFYSDRIKEKSNTREINQLTVTINDLAENMEKQEILRKRLTGDVAHELRTPLATLQSHLEAMMDGIWPADSERLKSCHEEIVRISKMVGDLEKLARYESENFVLNMDTFDITELAKRQIHNFESEFLSKGLELKLTGADCRVYADKDKISQVLVNLLSNALKYTPEGGMVVINIQYNDVNTEISVTDNGPGIPGEDLPYIFERFYRADKSRNKLTGGSGIGLAICKSIVLAHGGSINVQSNIGKGTKFTFTIPKI